MCRVIVRRGNAVLLVIKKSGKWELPGGKRKPYESKLECAKRELEEETGLHWLLGFKLADGLYECTVCDGCPKVMEPDKHPALGWFEELPDLTKEAEKIFNLTLLKTMV